MKLNAVISEMTNEELKDAIEEQVALNAKLKMNHAVSPEENPLQIRKVRRYVAKLKTEHRKREIAALQN